MSWLRRHVRTTQRTTLTTSVFAGAVWCSVAAFSGVVQAADQPLIKSAPEDKAAALVEKLVAATVRNSTAQAEQELQRRHRGDDAPHAELTAKFREWDPEFARLLSESLREGYARYATAAQDVATAEQTKQEDLRAQWFNVRRELELMNVRESQLNSQAAVRRSFQALLNFDNRWLWFNGTCGLCGLLVVAMWARRHELRRLMWTRRGQFWLLGVTLSILAVAPVVPTVLSFSMPAAKIVSADAEVPSADDPLAELAAEVAAAAAADETNGASKSVQQSPRDSTTLSSSHPGSVELQGALVLAGQVEQHLQQAAIAAFVAADLAEHLQKDLKEFENQRPAYEAADAQDRSSRFVQKFSGAITGSAMTLACGLLGLSLWSAERRKRREVAATCPKCLAVGKLRPADDTQRLGLRKLECTNVIVEEPFEDCRFSFSEADADVQKLGFSTLGIAQSGKTLSLVMLYRTLRRGAGAAAGKFERIASVGAESFDGFMDQVLSSRISLRATGIDAIPEPVMFRMADRDRLGSTQIMASLFDYAGAITMNALGGNAWSPTADFHRKRALDSDGFFFFIDPTRHADTQIEALDMFRDDLRLVKGLRLGQKMTRPVALCVSKIDTLVAQPQCAGMIEPFYDELRKIEHEHPGISLRAIERRSQLMLEYRDLIWPGWEVERAIADLFGGRFMFFPQTPVGLQQQELEGLQEQRIEPGDLSQRTFDPKYILEPLLWLLHMNGYPVLDP